MHSSCISSTAYGTSTITWTGLGLTSNCDQGVSLVVELSEPIQAAVSMLQGVEARAVKALAKGTKASQAKGDYTDQLLAFLQLVRWLQLYVTGDAENAEPELAEELAGIYKAAFKKGGYLQPKAMLGYERSLCL